MNTQYLSRFIGGKLIIAMLITLAAWSLPQTVLADYATNCQGCHGPLATSSKRGRSAATIQNAINNNVGGMGSASLRALTPAQVDAIAVQLGSPSTCQLPKVWDATGRICAAPPPVCTPPQVLQNGICVTPPPTCVPPQVLQNGICVTPPPGCIPPQVLQNGICVTPPPTCVPPQVLQNGICVTPPPTCVPPQVLQNGVCVTPPPPTADYSTYCSSCHGPLASSSVRGASASAIKNAINSNKGGMGSLSFLTAAQIDAIAAELGGSTGQPGVCGSNDDDDDDDDDDGDDFRDKGKPNNSQVIISTPANVSGHAGEQINFAVTAFDCGGRAVSIKAGNVPKGAKVSSRYDSTLQMQKATLTWTPASKYAGKTFNVVFKAQTKSRGSAASQSVPVQVLPANGNVKASRANAPVIENAIASAWYDYEAKQLEVTGQITFAPNTSKAARDNAASAAVVISHGQNNAELGQGTVDGEGVWSVTIPTDVPPCAVDASFLGKTASKAVSGVAQCSQ